MVTRGCRWVVSCGQQNLYCSFACVEPHVSGPRAVDHNSNVLAHTCDVHEQCNIFRRFLCLDYSVHTKALREAVSSSL